MICHPGVEIYAALAALNSMNYIILFMPGCFVLRVDKFLPQHVGRFEVNWDVMFIEDPPEFLNYSLSIRNYVVELPTIQHLELP